MDHIRSTEMNRFKPGSRYIIQNGGCHVTSKTGFVFVLLAVLLALGVGIIVHFAGSRDVTCKFDLCSDIQSELSIRCEKLAEKGNTLICTACPHTVTNNYTTTGPPSTSTQPTTTQFTTSSEPDDAERPVNYRLPTSLKPVHYDVELKPDFLSSSSSDSNSNDTKEFKLYGWVSIEIAVVEETDNITLHAHALNISKSSVSLVSDQSETLTVTDLVCEDETQFLVVYLDRSLVRGSYVTLKMNFTGKLTPNLSGFYIMGYATKKNESAYLAASLFQATYARTTFPCFDEPAMKATFNITLQRKVDQSRNYTTLSNTETVETQPREDDFVADVHAKTPVMSTYILAFIVCDFEYLENITSNGFREVTYRSWTRPDYIKHATMFHEIGLWVYNWLEKRFDPPFPLNKFDNVAVPVFKFGAMENWGLAMYRENVIYREGYVTTDRFSYIAIVIAHELSHQWFGNLVTAKWWSWLWLNEGLAMYWEWTIINELFPERREPERFLVKLSYKAMIKDSEAKSHPMTHLEVQNHEQIENNFDDITYNKAGAIVRMMSMIMGKPLFNKALNHYLKKHQYGSVDDNDFFNALTEEATRRNRGINMTEIMDCWVKQKNFPLVHVTRTGSGVIHVTQERFLSCVQCEELEDLNETAPYNFLWEIPISYTTSNEREFSKVVRFEDRKWLRKTKKEDDIYDATFPDPSNENSWVYVNTENHFYYVTYDVNNWNALINQLQRNFTVIPPIHRAQLIHNSWHIADAGFLDISFPLRILNYLKEDIDYVPWRTLDYFLTTLEGYLINTNLYDAFRKYMVDLTKKSFGHYGVVSSDNDITPVRYQRARVMEYACRFGSKKCRYRTSRLFKQWVSSKGSKMFHPDLRHIIYCNGIRYGETDDFEFVKKEFFKIRQSTESDNMKYTEYLLSLTCVEKPWRITSLMEDAMSWKTLSEDDVITLIKGFSVNPVGKMILWDVFTYSFDSLVASNRFSNSSLTTMIQAITDGFTTQTQYNKVKQFANSHDLKWLYTDFENALSKINKSIIWTQRNYETIKKWLTDSDYFKEDTNIEFFNT